MVFKWKIFSQMLIFKEFFQNNLNKTGNKPPQTGS